jgi:hypothetical protein
MGILDDAIRAHLELKRRHGAGDEELARIEREALGPARRPADFTGEPASEAAGEPVSEVGAEPPGAAGEPATEIVAGPESGSPPPSGEPASGATPPADTGDALAGPGYEPPGRDAQPPVSLGGVAPSPTPGYERPGPAAEPPVPLEEDPLPPVAAGPEDAEEVPVEPEEPRAAVPPPGSGHTAIPLDEDAPAELHDEDLFPAVPPDPELESEELEADEDDVLEETPDFLQETPEHDRLWFEQRPPRDFDFGS